MGTAWGCFKDSLKGLPKMGTAAKGFHYRFPHRASKNECCYVAVSFFKGTLKTDHRYSEAVAKQTFETGVRNRGPKQGSQKAQI